VVEIDLFQCDDDVIAKTVLSIPSDSEILLSWFKKLSQLSLLMSKEGEPVPGSSESSHVDELTKSVSYLLGCLKNVDDEFGSHCRHISALYDHCYSQQAKQNEFSERLTNLEIRHNQEANYRRGNEFINAQHGVPRSCELGLSILRQTTEESIPHLDSIYAVGRHLEQGLICRQDIGEAAKFYKRCAELGHSCGQVQYALCLATGLGQTQDLSEAARYFKLSADQGNSAGQFRYGTCLKLGHGVPKDEPTGTELIKRAAEQGHPEAQYNWGFILKYGSGVTKDEAEGARYYKLAADQGNSMGQNNYGACLEAGTGVAKNFVEAARYYKMSADQGNSWGQFHYGIFCEKGLGMQKNLEEAARYYKMSSDQENPHGMFHYGRCLRDAIGVPRDRILAREYLQRAAEKDVRE
jgi:TPR repeat protein